MKLLSSILTEHFFIVSLFGLDHQLGTMGEFVKADSRMVVSLRTTGQSPVSVKLQRSKRLVRLRLPIEHRMNELSRIVNGVWNRLSLQSVNRELSISPSAESTVEPTSAFVTVELRRTPCWAIRRLKR
jgi:hypothetical protein